MTTSLVKGLFARELMLKDENEGCDVLSDRIRAHFLFSGQIYSFRLLVSIYVRCSSMIDNK